MLTAPKKPEPGIRAGKFGYSGKMIIKPFSILPEEREKYLKAFRRFIKITICGCWEWQGRIHNGYGSISCPGGSTKWVHRVSYALFNGPIAENMHIDHKCRNTICANPAHVEQKTPQQNCEAIGRRKRRDEREAQEQNGQLRLFDV